LTYSQVTCAARYEISALLKVTLQVWGRELEFYFEDERPSGYRVPPPIKSHHLMKCQAHVASLLVWQLSLKQEKNSLWPAAVASSSRCYPIPGKTVQSLLLLKNHFSFTSLALSNSLSTGAHSLPVLPIKDSNESRSAQPFLCSH